MTSRSCVTMPPRRVASFWRRALPWAAAFAVVQVVAAADSPEVIPVAGQPLAANVNRLLQAMEFLGTPLSADAVRALRPAIADQDSALIQTVLDRQVLLVVQVSPE